MDTIRKKQFGFKEKHETTFQILRLADEHVTNAFNNRASTPTSRSTMFGMNDCYTNYTPRQEFRIATLVSYIIS